MSRRNSELETLDLEELAAEGMTSTEASLGSPFCRRRQTAAVGVGSEQSPHFSRLWSSRGSWVQLRSPLPRTRVRSHDAISPWGGVTEAAGTGARLASESEQVGTAAASTVGARLWNTVERCLLLT